MEVLPPHNVCIFDVSVEGGELRIFLSTILILFNQQICVLIPFTFKVINNRYGLTSILFIVFWLFYNSFALLWLSSLEIR